MSNVTFIGAICMVYLLKTKTGKRTLNGKLLLYYLLFSFVEMTNVIAQIDLYLLFSFVKMTNVIVQIDLYIKGSKVGFMQQSLHLGKDSLERVM